jgi:hypothetical protein
VPRAVAVSPHFQSRQSDKPTGPLCCGLPQSVDKWTSMAADVSFLDSEWKQLAYDAIGIARVRRDTYSWLQCRRRC